MEQAKTTGKRKKLNRAEWDEVIKAWQASSKPRLEFCRERGISYSKLCYWRGKLLRASKQNQDLVKFAQVKLKPPASDIATSPGLLKLSLPTGIILSIPPGTDETTLRLVLKLTRERVC